MPPTVRPAPAGLLTRVVGGLRSAWFGPSRPLSSEAPPETAGRQFDYPVGYNLRLQPRQDEATGFAELRGLADAYDLVRLAIETRNEVRAELGLDPVAGGDALTTAGPAAPLPGRLAKAGFDPGQPRDDDGKWSNDGTTGTADVSGHEGEKNSWKCWDPARSISFDQAVRKHSISSRRIGRRRRDADNNIGNGETVTPQTLARGGSRADGRHRPR